MTILGVRPTQLGIDILRSEVAGQTTNVTYDRVAILAVCPRDKHGTPWLPIHDLIKRVPTPKMKAAVIDNIIWMEKHNLLEISRAVREPNPKTTLTLQARTEDGYLVQLTIQAPPDVKVLRPNVDMLADVLESLPGKIRDKTSELTIA